MKAPNKELAAGEIHVWRVRLETYKERLESISKTLSASEIDRADRYKDALARERFVFSRTALREILSLYTGVNAGGIELETNMFGKPRLAGIASESKITFNVSCSSGLMLAGIALDMEVGVDVEAMKEGLNEADLAERFLPLAEVFAIRNAPLEDRRKIFYATWAMKEAVVKAVGKGLHIPLSSFVVDANATDKQLINIGSDEGGRTPYTLLKLDTGPGYAGAIAANKDFTLKLFGEGTEVH